MPSLVEIMQKVEISVAEYARLKDIETRFTVLKEQMLHAEYCPLHTQIILGIVNKNDSKDHDDFIIPPLVKAEDRK